MCKQYAPWSWGRTEQRSFDKLKDCLTTAPVLRVIDSGRCSVLTTDANEKTISANISHPDDDGVHNPIAYESRKLTAAEQAYPAHILDFLAVARALRTFCHYLLGSVVPLPNGVRLDFAGRLSLMAFAWTSFSALTIRRPHGSASNGTSINSLRAGWTKLKSFALMSSTYQENSIPPTLSLGAASAIRKVGLW